jgi:hypothetical protein
MIPGANLLRMALTAIAPQTVEYYAYTSRTLNAVGMYVTTFAEPVDVQGSFQPVPRALYQQLGLDFTKNYAMFYATQQLGDVTRDRTGDQLAFNGKRWQIEAANDWHAVDGWNGVLCIEVPAP